MTTDYKPLKLSLEYIREVARTHSWPTEDDFDELEAIKFLLRELDARASLAPKGWPSRETIEFILDTAQEFERFMIEMDGVGPGCRQTVSHVAAKLQAHHAAPQAKPDPEDPNAWLCALCGERNGIPRASPSQGDEERAVEQIPTVEALRRASDAYYKRRTTEAPFFENARTRWMQADFCAGALACLELIKLRPASEISREAQAPLIEALEAFASEESWEQKENPEDVPHERTLFIAKIRKGPMLLDPIVFAREALQRAKGGDHAE